MNCTIQFDERHVIPRWKSLHESLTQSELSAARKIVISAEKFGMNEYEQAKFQWEMVRNLPNAIEYMCCARAAGIDSDPDTINFVNRLISINSDIPLLVKEFVDEKKLFDELQSIDTNRHQKNIALFRSKTILYPNNAMYWAELSRYYLIAGETKKSERALKIANYLAPNNRYLLRATARYYHHVGDIDQALFVLRGSEAINSDPWLLASEIAISRSASRPSQKMKRAQVLLRNDDYIPASISELSSEFATLEAMNGDNKESRKLFRKALMKPNENSFAQIVWANERVLDLQYDSRLTDEIADSFESKVYLELYGTQDWGKIVAYLELWYLFQPFSSIPVIMSSMILADFLDDYSRAIDLCEMGLCTHRNNFSLFNNLVYALILSGDQIKAKDVIDKELSCYSEIHEEILFLAISGMYEMRFGNAQLGEDRYKEAIEREKKVNKPEDCSVIIYFAREKKRLGHDITEQKQYIARNFSSTRNAFIPALINKFEIST